MRAFLINNSELLKLIDQVLNTIKSVLVYRRCYLVYLVRIMELELLEVDKLALGEEH